MKILVTGGDGFIGSHICRMLVKNHHKVSVFTIKYERNILTDIEDKIQIYEGNITNKDRIKEVIEKDKPEVIIHLAAFGIGDNGVAKSVELDPETAFNVNVTGTYYLYEVAVENNVKQMIVSGSTTVYPTKDKINIETIDESVNLAASNLYGLTKQMVEKIADYFNMHHHLPTWSLRLPLVYGPGRWYRGAGGFLVDMIVSAYNGQTETIKGNTDPIDLMYVKDIAYLIEDILENSLESTGVVNVKSHTTTILEMVQIINRLVGDELLNLEKSDYIPTYPLVMTDFADEALTFQPRYTVEEACKDFLEEMKK